MTPRLKNKKKETLPTSVRVTPTCKYLWDVLAERMGLSNAKVLEVIIREKAKAEGIQLPTEEKQEVGA